MNEIFLSWLETAQTPSTCIDEFNKKNEPQMVRFKYIEIFKKIVS